MTPRSGVPVHRRALPPVDPDELTDKEIECLAMVACGCSNREIAHALHISVDGVKSRMRRLFYKLAARDRTQAVHHAWQHGLLGGDR